MARKSRKKGYKSLPCFSYQGDPNYFEFADTGYKTPCWLWRGTIHRSYGQVCIKGIRYSVHKWMYEEYYEEVPLGLVLDHLCKIKHCGNPHHLEVVTVAVNIARGG